MDWMDAHIGWDKKCKECGKVFLVRDITDYAYSCATGKTGQGRAYFCSWGCLRKWERDEEHAKTMRRSEAKRDASHNPAKTPPRKLSEEKKAEMCRLYTEGHSAREISQMVHSSTETIYQVLYKAGLREKKRKGAFT